VYVASGEIPLGSCERLGDERVVTRFAFLSFVFVPLDSLYVIGPWRGHRGFQVRKSGKSIALAYARFLTPIVPFFTYVAFAANAEGAPTLSAGQITTLALMGLGWLALFFVAGRTFGRAARQRRALAHHAGIAAPPEILFDGTLGLVLEDLERAWKSAASKEDAYRAEPYRSTVAAVPAWRDLFPKDVAPSTLSLYYALCRYAAALSGEEVLTNRARIAWERIEREGGGLGGASASSPAWLDEVANASAA
jgi:hypothetical protein